MRECRLFNLTRADCGQWSDSTTSFYPTALAPASGNHSTRYLPVHGILFNYLFLWLGHSSIQPPLIYLELVPDPTGSLASVP